MNFIFSVCIGVGILVPILDILLGLAGSIFGFDFDIGGHHAGEIFGIDGSSDVSGSSLPINIMCLCFALVVFGALGKLAVGLMDNIAVGIGLCAGLVLISVLAYRLLYTLVVKPLRKNDPRAIGSYDLLGKRGRLTLRITSDSPGTVSVKDSTGAKISYIADAKADVLALWDGCIPKGAEVIIADIDEDMKKAYVKPLNTFENQSLKK